MNKSKFNIYAVRVLPCFLCLAFSFCSTTEKKPIVTSTSHQNIGGDAEAEIRLFIKKRNASAFGGVGVRLEDQVIKTDAMGIARFKKPTSGEHLVEIFQENHASNFRTVSFDERADYTLIVNLVRRRKIVVRNLSEDVTAKSPDGQFAISIPARSLLDSAGNAVPDATIQYANIRFKEDGPESMPGEFRGLSQHGSVSLESIGAFEISANRNNQDLQIKPGKQLTVTIAAQGFTATTEEVPIWKFDQSRKTWIEEGRAKISMDSKSKKKRVELPVRSLQWWNCDYPVQVTSVWIKSFKLGKKAIPMEELAAAGVTYNGYSASNGTKMSTGLCVNVKRDSKVLLSARDSKNIAFHTKPVSTLDTASECSQNPEEGLILDELVMVAAKSDCGVSIQVGANANQSIQIADDALFGRNGCK